MISADGTEVAMVRRFHFTPDIVCNIVSEAVEVYEHGAKFSFDGTGRIMTMSVPCDPVTAL